MDRSAEYNLFLSKAMALCAGREMCSYDILRKLDSWGASEEISVKVLEQLIKEKFIDDVRYSAAYVKDKFRYNKWGKIKIGAHLRMKNIPGNIIGEALGIIDNETYIECLTLLIRTHKKSIRAKNSYDLRAKLLRYGLSKGFESNILYDLINNTEPE